MPEEAIDTSNYSGKYSVDWLIKVIEQTDSTLLIVGTQLPDITRWQFSKGRETGLMLRAYCQLEFDMPPEGQVQRSIDLCEGYYVQKLYLACEDEKASALTEEQTVDFIRRATAQATGKMRTGIYTREDWWIRQTGNSVAFSIWPLWDADYGDGDIKQGQSTLKSVDYGGWTNPEMRQYATTKIDGVDVDFNIFQPEMSPPPFKETNNGTTRYRR